MPLKLSNAPITFIRLLNQAYKDSIGQFVIVYFNDILLCRHSHQWHIDHSDQILIVLPNETL